MLNNPNGSATAPSRRASWLLAISVVTTVAVVTLGNSVVWGLYESTYTGGRPGVTGVRPAAAQPLRVGIARTPGGPGEWIAFAKVLARLQRDLGRPVVVRYALSSDDQIELLESGAIDVVLMSTLAYLDVQAAGVVTLVAAPVVLGRRMDAAVIVVADTSSTRRIEDLRGGSFAVSPDLAGAAFVYWLLEQRGEDPKGFFSATVRGVQDENLIRVSKGEVDATGVRRSALARWPAGMFRVIEESPDLGMPPIVARRSLDESTVAQVRRSLLAASTQGVIPQGSALTGFRAASDAEYDFARLLDAVPRGSEQDALGSAHQ